MSCHLGMLEELEEKEGPGCLRSQNTVCIFPACSDGLSLFLSLLFPVLPHLLGCLSFSLSPVKKVVIFGRGKRIVNGTKCSGLFFYPVIREASHCCFAASVSENQFLGLGKCFGCHLVPSLGTIFLFLLVRLFWDKNLTLLLGLFFGSGLSAIK